MDQQLRIEDHRADLYHLDPYTIDPYTPWGVDRRLMRITHKLNYMFNTFQFELALKYAQAKGVSLYGEYGTITTVDHVMRNLRAPNHYLHLTSPFEFIMSTLALLEQKMRRRPVRPPGHNDPTESVDKDH